MASKSFNNFLVRLNICVVFFFICTNFTSAIKSEEVDYDFSKVEHVIKPRHIRIYSKPPGENQEKQTGRGLQHHLDNALQGGSVGIEFNLRPIRERWSDFMDKARRYLPLLYKFKKKPIDDSEDSSEIPSKDSDEDKGVNPDVDLKPRLDTSNEDNPDDEYGEISMEFEIDPRRKVLNPEDIVLLEREKLMDKL